MSEKNTKENDLMEKIVSLCKRRGFVFAGSEIYGGLAGTYDFGHYGVALKNNIKQSWWKKFVDSRRDMYGLDAAILMNSKVWWQGLLIHLWNVLNVMQDFVQIIYLMI